MRRTTASLFTAVFAAWAATVHRLCVHTVDGADQKSGPYGVDVLSVTECPDPGTNEMVMNVRIGKSSKTDVCFSGWYYMPYGMTDDIQELWTIFSKGSTGGWKRMLSFRNRHACSDRRRLFPEWFNNVKSSNMSDGTCPIPPGNYTISCWIMKNFKFQRAKEMIYGMYKASARFYRNKVNIGCVEYEGSVYPSPDNTYNYTFTNGSVPPQPQTVPLH